MTAPGAAIFHHGAGLKWPPPNLELWLKPESLVAPVDGTRIVTWPDASGKGRDATDMGLGLGPFYSAAAGPNGKPALHSDGTAKLQVAGNAAFTGQSFEYFIVGAKDLNPGTQVMMSTFDNASHGIAIETVTGQWFLVAYDATNVGQSNAGDTVVAAETVCYNIRSNATRSGGHKNDLTTILPQLAPFTPITAGQALNFFWDPRNIFFVGYICEVLWFSRLLSATERGQVHDYLNGRYNYLVKG